MARTPGWKREGDKERHEEIVKIAQTIQGFDTGSA